MPYDRKTRDATPVAASGITPEQLQAALMQMQIPIDMPYMQNQQAPYGDVSDFLSNFGYQGNANKDFPEAGVFLNTLLANPTQQPQSPFGAPYKGSAPTYPSNKIDYNAARKMIEGLQPTGSQPEIDPLQAYLTSLMPQITSSEDQLQELMNKASGGINKSYNSQIGFLKHLNQGARKDTAHGNKQIKAMYRALQKDMNRLGQTEERSGAASAADIQALGQATGNQALANANQILEKNAAYAGNLGSPELMAALNPGVNAQQGAIAGRALTDAEAQAAGVLGNASKSKLYFDESQGAAGVEGTNRRADLIGQLQDYLASNRAKMGDLAGQRASALADLQSRILTQNQDDTFGQQNTIFNNALQLAQMFGGQQEQAQDPYAALNGLLPDSVQYINQMTAANPELAAAYNMILGTPEAQMGVIDQGHDKQLPLYNNEAAIRLLLAKYGGQLQGLNPQLLAALGTMLGQTHFNSGQ